MNCRRDPPPFGGAIPGHQTHSPLFRLWNGKGQKSKASMPHISRTGHLSVLIIALIGLVFSLEGSLNASEQQSQKRNYPKTEIQNLSGERLAQWLSRLVQIPSVNPDQAGTQESIAGEGLLASGLARFFRELGGEVYLDEVIPGRPNVYGIWRGRSEAWIAVDIHLDTVGIPLTMTAPFSGKIENGRVYGRGSVDTKATLAVVLGLLEAMHESGVRPGSNLLIAGTIDEESQLMGAPAFSRWVRSQGLKIDQLAVAEPTLCGPAYGHKGIARVGLLVQGKSAHASRPELGENAITAAAMIVSELEQVNKRLQSVKGLLGPPKLTVTLIRGGAGHNTVPNSCEITIDRRIVAGEKPAEVANQIYRLAQRTSPLPVVLINSGGLNAFLQRPDTPWIRQLAEWSGREPTVVPYTSNACAYGNLAREIVLIGPGSIDQAHTDSEWVAISELQKLAGLFALWWRLEH
jgi:acetylornithine deacetylase/succinyl-diaminopimelate desuccinylase-like protein